MNFHTLFNNVSLFIQRYIILVFSHVMWTQRPLTLKAARDQEQVCHGQEWTICLFILFYSWRLWFFSISVPPHPWSTADADICCLNLQTIYAFRLYITVFAFENFIQTDVWRETSSVSFCLVLEVCWICVWPANANNFVIFQNSKESGNILQSGFFSCHLNNRESKSSLHTYKLIWRFSTPFYSILYMLFCWVEE